MKFQLLLLFLFPLTVQAQTLTILGKIVDHTTGEPVAYAHVGIPERGIGTTSAWNGEFTLRIPEYYANSQLTVSFIGYDTYEKSIADLSGYLTIRLKQVATELTQIVVRDESAVEDIIRKAVRAIPNNYPTKPTNQVGFYRESKTTEPGKYAYLAEGVLDVYKTSYKNDSEGQVALVEGRQVSLVPLDELDSATPFSSGHLAPHRFDFVKNREDFIDEEYFDDYQYYIEGITAYNGRPVYIIGFDREGDAPDGRMKGRMFIDTSSYAFLRAEFEITPYGMKKRSDYPLYVGAWTGNSYVVTYREVDGKWQFSSALREGTWRDGGIYSNEILITEFKPGRGKPLPYLDRMNRNEPFRRLTGMYDPDFWSAYNVAPLSNELQESVNQRQTQQLAEQVFDSTFMAQIQARQDSALQKKVEEAIAERTADPANSPIPVEQAPAVLRFKPARFSTAFGANVHLVNSGVDDLTISYIDPTTGNPIVQTAGPIEEWRFEYLLDSDIRFLINKNWFLKYGFTFDFYNSIYRESSFGTGLQLNLSKQRPFYFRLAAAYSSLKYARKHGQATNEFGKFKAGSKNFKAEKINLYYGHKIRNLKASVELAIELHPGMELFLRGTYLLPFTEQPHVYLWERKELFRKKERLKLEEELNLQVTSFDQPFSGRIGDYQTFILTAGLIFK